MHEFSSYFQFHSSCSLNWLSCFHKNLCLLHIFSRFSLVIQILTTYQSNSIQIQSNTFSDSTQISHTLIHHYSDYIPPSLHSTICSLSLSLFIFINHYLRNCTSFPFHFFLFYLFVSILRIVLLFFSSFSHYFHALQTMPFTQAFFLIYNSIINNLLPICPFPICPFVELMPQMVHQLRLSIFWCFLPIHQSIHLIPSHIGLFFAPIIEDLPDFAAPSAFSTPLINYIYFLSSWFCFIFSFN